MNKEHFLNIIGLSVFSFGLIALIVSIKIESYQTLLWLCYWAWIISGIGILIRSDVAVQSQLNIILVPSLIWVIDLISGLTGKFVFGFTRYFFEQTGLLERVISLGHVFFIPLVLYSLYSIKNKKQFDETSSWKISFIQIIVFYILSLTYTDPNYNLNCVFSSCFEFIETNQFYPIIWFTISFVMISLTYLALYSLFRKNVSRQRRFLSAKP